MNIISWFTDEAFQRKLLRIMDLDKFHLELVDYRLPYNTDEIKRGSTEELESIINKLNMQSSI